MSIVKSVFLVSSKHLYKSKSYTYLINSMSTLTTSTSSDLVNNLLVVRNRIVDAAVKAEIDSKLIQLIAVSKTKPSDNIQELYDTCGQRKFGENYFQELVEKAETLPSDIEWHFIGHLQSAKASKLVRCVPNLAVVETLDSLKLANKLNAGCEAANRESLDVYIQIDTSGEETKSGIDISELHSFVDALKSDCPRLNIKGLMTIGAPGDSSCFAKLASARILLADLLSIKESDLALSMGMSGDFEEAILHGATSVRIGSTIFGPRLYAASKPVV